MNHPTKTSSLEGTKLEPVRDDYFYLFVDQHDHTHGVGKYTNKFGDVTGMWYMDGPTKVRLDMNRLMSVMPATHPTANKPGFRYVSYPEFMANFDVHATVDGSVIKFITTMGRHVTDGQVKNRAIARISHELNRQRSIPTLVTYFKTHPDQLSIRRL